MASTGKCPFCGAVETSDQKQCPECGAEMADDGYCGVCWEREQNNLWVRLNENVFCLQYENGTWNRNDDAKRPEYIALAYDWDGTIKD